MTPEVLSLIKKQLQEFLPVVEAIVDHWNNDGQYITMSVLLQNMAFNPINCVGYSHEKEVEKVKRLRNIFKMIKEYKKSHFETWIYEEIDSIIEFTERANDW